MLRAGSSMNWAAGDAASDMGRIDLGTEVRETARHALTLATMIVVPLFDLKFLMEFAGGEVGAANRRHWQSERRHDAPVYRAVGRRNLALNGAACSGAPWGRGAAEYRRGHRAAPLNTIPR